MSYLSNSERPSVFGETAFGKKKRARKPRRSSPRRSYTPRKSYTPRRAYRPRRSYTPRRVLTGINYHAPDNTYDPDKKARQEKEKKMIEKVTSGMTANERADYFLRMSRFGNTNKDIKYLLKL